MLVARRFAAVLAAAAVLTALGGCFPGAGGGNKDGTVTVWTVLVLPNEVARMESVLSSYTDRTGVETELVAIDPADMPTAVTNAAAAGELPDVLLHTVDLTQAWASNGILDADAATSVVASLDPETFNPTSLDLVSSDGQPVAVPSDGWGQVIFYRTDLFAQADLQPPTTYAAITKAARVLDNEDRAGILAGTSTSTPYTQQTFEHLALANGCELLGSDGEVAFDTPECIHAVERYTTWMSEYSAGGQQDELSTRATYLSGRAAMMVWSPHLLDELNNLSTEISPSCEPCADDPRWLAENTGFVQQVSGPDGSPVQFGQTLNFGITPHGDVSEAKQLVTSMLSDSYGEFLSVAPEGQFPMRPDSRNSARKHVAEWTEAEVGDVEQPRTVGELLSDGEVAAVSEGATSFRRWGITEGQGDLVQALYGEFVVPRALQQVREGTLTPKEATQQVQQRAEQLNVD